MVTMQCKAPMIINSLNNLSAITRTCSPLLYTTERVCIYRIHTVASTPHTCKVINMITSIILHVSIVLACSCHCSLSWLKKRMRHLGLRRRNLIQSYQDITRAVLCIMVGLHPKIMGYDLGCYHEWQADYFTLTLAYTNNLRMNWRLPIANLKCVALLVSWESMASLHRHQLQFCNYYYCIHVGSGLELL